MINLDNLTIGQAREIAASFGGTATIAKESPFIHRHCVVRTYSAGVHIGTVASIDGTAVVLTGARRLWKWGGAFTLSEVATVGINPAETRMAVAIDEMALTQVTEIIPTKACARETFEACHE